MVTQVLVERSDNRDEQDKRVNEVHLDQKVMLVSTEL